jgi:hypothetical protein
MTVAIPISVRVRLIRKLADELDGIDLSEFHVGDIVKVADPLAQVLIAEGWAIAERRTPAVLPQVVAFRRNSDPGHHWWEEDDACRAS